MAEVINLRQTRKARKRAESAEQASANRAKFGQSKAETARQRMDAERQTRQLDGAKRDPD